jgi:ABC-2 type transport system ATP-binding protein
VFLDEPTSGLDPLGRLLVRDVIRELKGRGTAVFLNSHLLGEVEATCDRVVFIKRGRTVRELVLGAAGGALEVELRLGAVNPAVLEGLAAFGRDVAVGPAEGVVRLTVEGEALVPEIARWVVSRGLALHGLRAGRRSLEAMFLEVMGDEGRPG